jgi:hypothetical protein
MMGRPARVAGVCRRHRHRDRLARWSATTIASYHQAATGHRGGAQAYEKLDIDLANIGLNNWLSYRDRAISRARTAAAPLRRLIADLHLRVHCRRVHARRIEGPRTEALTPVPAQAQAQIG